MVRQSPRCGEPVNYGNIAATSLNPTSILHVELGLMPLVLCWAPYLVSCELCSPNTKFGVSQQTAK